MLFVIVLVLGCASAAVRGGVAVAGDGGADLGLLASPSAGWAALVGLLATVARVLVVVDVIFIAIISVQGVVFAPAVHIHAKSRTVQPACVAAAALGSVDY